MTIFQMILSLVDLFLFPFIGSMFFLPMIDFYETKKKNLLGEATEEDLIVSLKTAATISLPIFIITIILFIIRIIAICSNMKYCLVFSLCYLFIKIASFFINDIDDAKNLSDSDTVKGCEDYLETLNKCKGKCRYSIKHVIFCLIDFGYFLGIFYMM